MLCYVLVTVSEPGLAAVLSSQYLLFETWRDAAREVMVLLQVLRTAAPTLADVLAVGLIVLAAAPATRSVLVLQYRRATFTVLGRRADGTEVPSSMQECLREITQVEVREVRVTDPVLAAR
jgi:hypothetical protein